MKESIFQTQFTKWAKYNLIKTTVCELKLVKGKRLPFTAFKPHQIPSLISAKKRKLFYKIPDAGFGIKPFDCFLISGADSYVVIMFYEKKGEKEFYMIDVDDFVGYINNNQTAKSITREEVKKIAKRVERLN